ANAGSVGPRGRYASRKHVTVLLYDGTGDHQLAALVLLAQPVHELGAQDVDLAVEDPALVRDFHLVLGQLLDELFELGVGQRAEVGEGVHSILRPGVRDARSASITAPS